jgi:hypothetical protein
MNTFAALGFSIASAGVLLSGCSCIHRPTPSAGRSASTEAHPADLRATVQFRLTPASTALQCGSFAFRTFRSNREDEGGRSWSDVLTLHDFDFSNDTLLVIYSDEHKCDPLVLAGPALVDAIRRAAGREVEVPISAPATWTVLRLIDHEGIGRAGVRLEWSDHESATSDQWGVVRLGDDHIASSCRCDGFAFVDADGKLRDRLSMPEFDLGACFDVEMVPLGK